MTEPNTSMPGTDPFYRPATGLWVRGGALFLDVLVVGIPLGLLFKVTGKSYGLAVAAGLIYNTLMVGSRGLTVGKMAAGATILRDDGGKVSYSRAFARAAVSMLLFPLAWLDDGVALLNHRKKALHDYISGTRVVYMDPVPNWRQALVMAPLLMVLSFIFIGSLMGARSGASRPTRAFGGENILTWGSDDKLKQGLVDTISAYSRHLLAGLANSPGSVSAEEADILESLSKDARIHSITYIDSGRNVRWHKDSRFSGWPLAELHRSEPPPTDALKQVYLSGKPIVRRFESEQGVFYQIAVPLSSKGEIYGVVDMIVYGDFSGRSKRASAAVRFHYEEGLRHFNGAAYNRAAREWVVVMRLDRKNAEAAAGLKRIKELKSGSEKE
jgi:uncharacterized RDD family membrane protein YckC